MNPIEEIKQRVDIVDLINGYLTLTPGGANWKARCPFHNEKSPSFMVSREKGIWHCFGCGKGGDIFTFIQEAEGMDFAEALHLLAQRAGVTLQREDPRQRTKRQRAVEINALAAKLYYRVLLEHPKAAQARAYLAQRGVTEETLGTFQLGYAPDAWEGVSQFLQSRGFSEEEIFQAGLTVKRERGSGYYDRFRNRIMFPVSDHLGRVVGFSARAMEPSQSGEAPRTGQAGSGSAGQPKYLNTPQTALYNKSAVLYGLYQAKTAIKSHQLAVIVEGNMDVLASHQAGVGQVVASSGTALTREQIRLLKRYTDNIALAFDMDVAGQSASMRGIDMAWNEGVNVRVITLPFGKDPDELIRKDVKRWHEAVEHSQPFMDYAFDRVQKTLNLFRVEDKKTAAKRLLPLIGRLPDAIEQTHYLQKLARLLQVPEEVLREKLSTAKRQPPSANSRRRAEPQEPPADQQKSRLQRVAEQLLALASREQEYLDYLIDHVEPEYFGPTSLLGLYKALVTYYTEKHQLDQKDFLQRLGREDQELAQRANVLFLLGTSDLLPTDEHLRRQELLEGVTVLKHSYVQSELVRLRSALEDAEHQGRTAEVEALSGQVNDLTKQLATVQLS